MSDRVNTSNDQTPVQEFVDGHNQLVEKQFEARVTADGDWQRGRTGSAFPLDEPPEIGLFGITGEWEVTGGEEGEAKYWRKCTAKRLWFDLSDEDEDWFAPSDDDDDPYTLWWPRGFQLPQEMRNKLMTAEDFMPKLGIGDWCWAIVNPASGYWEVVDRFEDVCRARLDEDLYKGGSALATLIVYVPILDENGERTGATAKASVQFTVHDDLGEAELEIAGSVGSGSGSGDTGTLVAGAGTYVWVKYMADSLRWSLLNQSTAGDVGSQIIPVLVLEDIVAGKYDAEANRWDYQYRLNAQFMRVEDGDGTILDVRAPGGSQVKIYPPMLEHEARQQYLAELNGHADDWDENYTERVGFRAGVALGTRPGAAWSDGWRGDPQTWAWVVEITHSLEEEGTGSASGDESGDTLGSGSAATTWTWWHVVSVCKTNMTAWVELQHDCESGEPRPATLLWPADWPSAENTNGWESHGETVKFLNTTSRRVTEGTRVECLYDPATNYWRPVRIGESELTPFELTEWLASTGTGTDDPRTGVAEARILTVGENGLESSEDNPIITVYDQVLGGRPAAPGARGWAQVLSDGKYYIVNLDRIPQVMSCKTKYAVDKTDESFNVYEVEGIDGGYWGDGESTNLSVDNWAFWEAAADTPLRIQWNSTLGGWEFLQGPCKQDFEDNASGTGS